jgi:cytosine/adenosine deaminase-related metal-dependent hydrolase
MIMQGSMLLKSVRPAGGPLTDVLVHEGRFALHDDSPARQSIPVVDGKGALMLPGLVEAHTHLDKNLYGMDWYSNDAGPRISDMIANERVMRKNLGIDPGLQAARQIVLSLAYGTTHIRTHVDVDTEIGVASIEAVMATRERFRDVVDIEIVVFPQSGLLVRPGTLELMETALRLGAEVVGGIDPCAIDRDPKGHIDAVFGLAERFGRPIDIHLHEPGDLGAFSVQLVIERTKALGMQGKVTLSHAFCLGSTELAAVDALIEGIRSAEINVLTTAYSAFPAAPVKRLTDAGVLVGGGSDGIRTTWGPQGNGDMLERAALIAAKNGFRRDKDLELALDVCTYGGAKMMAIDGYGLAPGCWADFILVDGQTVPEAVVAKPRRNLVVKHGHVVARDGQAVIEAA